MLNYCVLYTEKAGSQKIVSDRTKRQLSISVAFRCEKLYAVLTTPLIRIPLYLQLGHRLVQYEEGEEDEVVEVEVWVGPLPDSHCTYHKHNN